MALTLGNLVVQPDFGLQMVVSPEGALDRRVLGVHSIEIADPMRFLRADWVMLCNGLRLRNRPEEQRRLVAELQHGRITALGFGLNEFFARLPAALLSEAEERGLPLFTIEGPTPFRDIISFVSQANLDHGVYYMRRALALHDDLMDGLAEQDPKNATVTRLAEAVDGASVLFSRTGEPLTVVGDIVPAELWSLIDDGVRGPVERELGERRAWLAPVIVDGRPRRWFGLCVRDPGLGEQLLARVVHSAQRLLEVAERGRRAAEEQAAGLREQLLLELVAGSAHSVQRELAQRAGSVGLDFREPAQVIAASLPDSGGLGEREQVVRQHGARARLERHLDWTGLPYLLVADDGVFTALVQGVLPDLDTFVAALADEGCALYVGVGGRVSAPAGAPDSHRDAILALERIRADHPQAPAVLHAASMGLIATVISDLPREELGRRVDQLLGELRGQPMLYDTLVAFLEHDLDVAATAGALFLHTNSLRYRLSRIESVLGISLHHVPTIADLYLAVTADRLTCYPRQPES